MGLAIVDPEGQTRLLSFSISPGHTVQEWSKLFDRTQGMYAVSLQMIVPACCQCTTINLYCPATDILPRNALLLGLDLSRQATTAIMYYNGEDPIKQAFDESKAFAQADKHTCTRGAAWSLDESKPISHASVLGAETAEHFRKLCAPASCKHEFVDACHQLEQSLRDANEGAKADYILKMRDNGEGFYNLPPVMMSGPEGPGIIESTVEKLKRTERSKRTVFMVVKAMLRACCDLAPRQVVGIYKINKFFKGLIKKQHAHASVKCSDEKKLREYF